eukprot:9493404-Pyramimonas_sp.AAC.1
MSVDPSLPLATGNAPLSDDVEVDSGRAEGGNGPGYAAAFSPEHSPSAAVPDADVQGHVLVEGARPKRGQRERRKQSEAVDLGASDEDDPPAPVAAGRDSCTSYNAGHS